MHAWMHGCMDAWMHAHRVHTPNRTDGRMDGWTDGRTDGRMDGWMDGWMDGCQPYPILSIHTHMHACMHIHARH
jgi:hypothetical protein